MDSAPATLSPQAFASAGGVVTPSAAPATLSPDQFSQMGGVFQPAQGSNVNPSSTSPFNPNTPNSQFVNPNQGQPGVFQKILSGANNFVNSLPQAAQDTLGNAFVKPFAQTAVSGYNAVKAAQDFVQSGGQPNAQAGQDLNQPRNLGPILGTVAPFSSQTTQPNSILPGPGTIQAVGTGFQMGGTADLANSGVDALQSANESALAANQSQADTASINKLQETISPKITTKETQAIINEGRLTRGSESPIFGKQPDIVTQADNVKQAAQVIHDNIPNASQMNDVQLSNALNTKITETAQSLTPQMQATPIHPDTPAQVQETWQSLKTEQQARPEFLDNRAGNTAFQNKFQNYLKQATDGQSMNDIWQARQAYDASVPTSVKNATTASPPQFQVRKAMWLENRAILNSAINDTSTGLGTASQKAFSDMSSMYDARENLAAKAKIDTTGTPGILPTTKMGWAKLIGGAGATLTGLDYGLHKLGL